MPSWWAQLPASRTIAVFYLPEAPLLAEAEVMGLISGDPFPADADGLLAGRGRRSYLRRKRWGLSLFPRLPASGTRIHTPSAPACWGGFKGPGKETFCRKCNFFCGKAGYDD